MPPNLPTSHHYRYAADEDRLYGDHTDTAVEPFASTEEIDTTRAHSARVTSYWMGGKDFYFVDRDLADKIAQVYPGIADSVRHRRAFHARAVRYLAQEGIRQFLDIGVGLPAVDDTHEVAQRITPQARTVYVDNDPLAVITATALLTCRPPGVCAVVSGDLHDPDTIVTGAADVLDLTQPAGLLLLGVLQHIADTAQARASLSHLMAALAPGSHLVVSHPTSAVAGAQEAAHLWNEHGASPPVQLREPEELSAFFDGLDLLDPGVVSCSHWRLEAAWQTPPSVDEYCGVGKKPSSPAEGCMADVIQGKTHAPAGKRGPESKVSIKAGIGDRDLGLPRNRKSCRPSRDWSVPQPTGAAAL